MHLMMEYRFYRLTFGYRENLVSRDYKALPLYLKNLTWKSQNPQDSVISSALSEIEVLFHKKNHFELNWIQLT